MVNLLSGMKKKVTSASKADNRTHESSEALGKASKTSKTQTVLERKKHNSLAKQTLGLELSQISNGN